MIKSLYTSATGMKAQQVMVDTIANNVANVNTAGFKRSQVTFEDLLYVTERSPGLERNQRGSASPIGLEIGSGARLSGTTRIYTPGTLEVTSRSLDIAIDGDGFLRVELPDGEIGYSRDGHLQINADGRLVTSSGYVVQPAQTFPNDVEFINIDSQGRVTGRIAGSNADDVQDFQTIELARFVNPSGLLAEGGNVFRATAASGREIIDQPGQNGLGTLRQGFLERSNVEIVNELVNLIVAQRAYEVNSRSIQASDQMLSNATQILR
ncbi:MAG: flagellar basal-body rod protein FlgG [Planctomycetota bacterium]